VSYCDLPPSQETKVVELANLGKPPDADAATNAAIDKSLDLLGDQDLGARLQLVRQLPTLAVYDLVDLSATPRQLAVFSVYFERGKAKLRFAWGGSAAGERNQLKKLADCVVQVELRGAETRSHLVALAKPTPLDRVRLDQGTGQVKRSSLPDEVFDEVAWQKRLAEAYLGGGKLHLSDKSTVDFFDGPAVARRRVVHPSLAKRLNATQVVVEYASGIFKVLAEYDPAQADARSQKAELVAKRAARKQQDDYRRWVLQQKATFEDAARATDEKRYAAAVAIGRQLLSEDLPPAPEDRDELKLRLSEWRMKINNAATTRAVALEEQIAALDGQIQALEAAIPPEVRDAEDLSIVTGLSATLYRNVEGVRVDTVILGTP